MHQATIHTSKWPIRVRLHDDKVPFTVANFVTLANNSFYDGLTFHRVIEDFMIQAGCPLGTGTWGPGYQFGDEFHPELMHVWPGILSMANSGPWTNGSQFFITHVETPRLDGKHAIFGKVIDDSDQIIVNSITQDDIIEKIEIHPEQLNISKEAMEFALQIQNYLDNLKSEKWWITWESSQD